MENSVLEPLVIKVMNSFETDSEFLLPASCIKNYANILMPFSLKMFFNIYFIKFIVNAFCPSCIEMKIRQSV